MKLKDEIRGDVQNTKEEVVAKLREKISQEISYEFGKIQNIVVVPDKNTVRLICGDNPDGIEEILIGATPQILYIYCFLKTGGFTGGGSSWPEVPGSFRQTGSSAAIGLWEYKDEKINVKFQLTDDDKTLIKSYRALEEASKAFPKKSFSLMIRDWDLLLDNTEMFFPRLNSAQRIEVFTRLWSTVKFNFVNFDLVSELNWDNILTEYLPKVMEDQSNDTFIRLLQKCMALLKDGHTEISSVWGNGISSACPPLLIRSVGGKAVITQVGETEEIKNSGIKSGDEITRVDGHPVQEILEKDIYPYISASTSQARDLKAYPRILWGPKNSMVSISLKSLEGDVRNISLTRKTSGLSAVPQKNPQSVFEYCDMKDGIVYVALNSFGSDNIINTFKENSNKICQAKGLIIDVRKNSGGNSGFGDEIISLLIDKAIPGTRWKTPQYRAAFRAWGNDEQWFDGGVKKIEPKTTNTITGLIVVLIGPQTFSAAEDFVVPLHAAGRATIVGQKSGGSTGQPLQFNFLDGKIIGRVCTKRDTYPDGREFVGVGIIPDVEVNPTASDIASGRDVVLEKGLEVLREKIKLTNKQ